MIRQLNALEDTARRSAQVAHILALINLPEDRGYRPHNEALVAMAQKILESKP